MILKNLLIRSGGKVWILSPLMGSGCPCSYVSHCHIQCAICNPFHRRGPRRLAARLLVASTRRRRRRRPGCAILTIRPARLSSPFVPISPISSVYEAAGVGEAVRRRRRVAGPFVSMTRTDGKQKCFLAPLRWTLTRFEFRPKLSAYGAILMPLRLGGNCQKRRSLSYGALKSFSTNSWGETRFWAHNLLELNPLPPRDAVWLQKNLF